MAVPFGAAALAYVVCAWQCGAALFPVEVTTGIAGGELLKDAKDVGATLPQMQERAAEYLDEKHSENAEVLKGTAVHVQVAIVALAGELLGLAVALVVTLLR